MYLISPDKKQYKANLHCHSVYSDGKKTPEELKEMYKEKGYSILSITWSIQLSLLIEELIIWIESGRFNSPKIFLFNLARSDWFNLSHLVAIMINGILCLNKTSNINLSSALGIRLESNKNKAPANALLPDETGCFFIPVPIEIIEINKIPHSVVKNHADYGEGSQIIDALVSAFHIITSEFKLIKV